MLPALPCLRGSYFNHRGTEPQRTNKNKGNEPTGHHLPVTLSSVPPCLRGSYLFNYNLNPSPPSRQFYRPIKPIRKIARAVVNEIKHIRRRHICIQRNPIRQIRRGLEYVTLSRRPEQLPLKVVVAQKSRRAKRHGRANHEQCAR